MKFINIHTHQRNTDSKTFSVLNCYPNSVDFTVPFSVGIHPWYLDKNAIKKELILMENQLQNTNCIALGECGLDRVAKADFEFQQEVFVKQIKLSEKHKKPLIIHCVKAFDKLIAFKKELKPTQKWIVHGFHKNKQLGESLLKNGLFLSFGNALLQKETLQELVTEIEFSQFFLETDDADVNIKELYRKVALLKRCSVQKVQQEMYENFKEKIKQ